MTYINLDEAALGVMRLCACVSEERGDGEGADSQALSDTLIGTNVGESGT